MYISNSISQCIDEFCYRTFHKAHGHVECRFIYIIIEI